MNTKRLTKIYDNGFVTLEAAQFAPIAQETMDRNIQAFEPFAAAVKRLAEYEDAAEQGLLVRLPCKAGDTVYEICRRLKNGVRHKVIVERRIGIIEIARTIIGFRCGTTIWLSADSLGKTIFLTREEAEQALKETDNDSSGND